jgi:phage shock protein PspC (stress-responsive transcriptional regulator)
MSIMKTKMLYALIVVIVIAVVLVGWYAFSSMAAYITRWQCLDIRTNTTSYICSSTKPSYPPYANCQVAGVCGGGGGGGGGHPLMT